MLHQSSEQRTHQSQVAALQAQHASEIAVLRDKHAAALHEQEERVHQAEQVFVCPWRANMLKVLRLLCQMFTYKHTHTQKARAVQTSAQISLSMYIYMYVYIHTYSEFVIHTRVRCF
jgi:hypothetical protein